MNANRDSEDEEYSFLVRWFARLDVFGSFSNKTNDSPLPVDAYWLWDAEENFQLDCLLGTSRFCIVLLAKIATLVKEYAGRDITGVSYNTELSFSKSALEQANQIQTWKLVKCTELEKDTSDYFEVDAINTAFHLTGIVIIQDHFPQEKEGIQVAVQTITNCITQVRAGSAAEPCMLLPMSVAALLTENALDCGWINERLWKMADLRGGSVSPF